MNKKLVASLVSCMVLGSVSVYAANPFSDVDASSWAYQSVEQLANAGIIQRQQSYYALRNGSNGG